MSNRVYVVETKSKRAEIVRLQGGDPNDFTWPEWSPQANTLRWFNAIRAKFGLKSRSEGNDGTD